jgi:hypothetical protein
MKKFIRTIAAAAALVIGLGEIPAIAEEASIEAFVTVPNAPGGGASFYGCYAANQLLFGRYRFTFCLRRNGTFSVRGAEHCDGRLTWRTNRRDINVNIQRTPCRRNVTWARATMTCHPTGGLLNNIFSQLRPGGGRVTRMVSALRCTYFPTVRGFRNQTFTARHT